MADTISIIIPVYNVAAYLPQCLGSILSQDYPHLEIILIDDGSTDSSGEICDEYAAKDIRIVVIHQKNSGAAAAKNAGLQVATGEYLSFVDSDDFLEPDAYSHMLALLEQNGADVVQCAYRDVFTDKTINRITNSEQCIMSGEAYLARFTLDWTCALLWNKLYRRSLFDGIFFEEGHKIDDEYFTYQGIMNASRIVLDDRIVYNYRRRRSSVMLSPENQVQLLLDRIDYIGKRRKNILSRYPALRKAFDSHFLDAMVILSRDPAGTQESLEIIRKQLTAYFRERGHTVPDIHLLPALLRIRFGKGLPPANQEDAPCNDPESYFS